MAEALPARFTGGGEASQPAPQAEPVKTAAKRTPSNGISALSSADQTTYRKAEAVAHDEDSEGALEVLAPLMERYPDCYAVQHMACGLLMQLGRADQVQTVCRRAMALGAKP